MCEEVHYIKILAYIAKRNNLRSLAYFHFVVHHSITK